MSQASFGFRVLSVTALVVGMAAPASAQKKGAVAAPYVPPAGAWERRSPSAMGMDSVKLAAGEIAQGGQLGRPHHRHDGGVVAVLADQGEGLDDEQQARVFGKFERLGRSGDGGTGLGLYISRHLARAMGGDLIVASAPGEGARFVLRLPSDPSA